MIYIFAMSPQGRNIVNEIEFSKSGIRRITTMLALWLWAYNCYKLSATALSLIDNKLIFGANEKLARKIESYLPAMLGYFPFILSISIIYSVKEIPDYKILIYLLVVFIYFMLYLLLKSGRTLRIGSRIVTDRMINIATLYIFFVYGKLKEPLNKWVDDILNRQLRQLKPLEGERIDFRIHWRTNMNGEQIINWTAHVLLYISIGIWPVAFGSLLGPIGVVFYAMSAFVVLGTIFVYLRDRFGFPMLPVLFVMVLLFSGIGDNNMSGVVGSIPNKKRESLSENFESWIKKRAEKEDTIKIVLVAAEGGGQRSAYWTYSVLRNLHLQDKAFDEQLYAISSVSGGSVGAALYATELLDGIDKPLNETPIINDDNISPVLAGLFFRELVQSILPFGVEGLDRSKVLDQTFESHWHEKHPEKNLWNMDFAEFQNSSRTIPAMFINSLHVESGNSAVLSNLSFDTSKVQSIDMYSKIQSSLTLSEVVGLSCRFPFVMPAGKFENEDGTTWGHLADGGYFENSGVATIYQVYLNLRDDLKKMKWTEKEPVVIFNIVFIANCKLQIGK